MGAAWEGEGSLLAVVSTSFARGRGCGGRFSLVCVDSWSCGAPGWLPSREWFFSSCGSSLPREGPGVLEWVLCPGSESRGLLC